MRLYRDDLSLYYEQKEDHIVIVEGSHNIEYARIPEEIDGLPVTKIFKKAFLACKLLKEVSLPDTVEEIGDFAFALCDHLSLIRFPRKELKLGQNIFKNDNELAEIVVGGDEKASALLAASPVVMNADYLIDTLNAGSAEWYKMWDQKLVDLLGRKDDEGYHLYVLCGEEDLHFDYDQYIVYIQEKKSGLCMLRLLHATNISNQVKDKLVNCLAEHVKEENCNEKGSNPVFDYLIKNHGNDEIYYEMLINEGIITKDNKERLIILLGDRFPQAKAYLINSFNSAGESDFFDGMEL